jgi:hypothetical protein
VPPAAVQRRHAADKGIELDTLDARLPGQLFDGHRGQRHRQTVDDPQIPDPRRALRGEKGFDRGATLRRPRLERHEQAVVALAPVGHGQRLVIQRFGKANDHGRVGVRAPRGHRALEIRAQHARVRGPGGHGEPEHGGATRGGCSWAGSSHGCSILPESAPTGA